jgi:tetratricopeptide (TPR) repeat protein
MSSVLPEWDDYLQAFRLHQGLSRESNFETQRLLKRANATAQEEGRVLPRAYGLLAFTIQSAWLSDWIDLPMAQELLATAIADIGAVTAKHKLPADTLNDLKKAGGSIDDIVKCIDLAYARISVALDDQDYDNRWSLATANLYAGNFAAAFAGYKKEKDEAEKWKAPKICIGSIDADNADALFFAGGPADSLTDADQRAAIELAIKDTEAAIAANINDPKRRWWNWTLGWAYYELGAYCDKKSELECCAKSLMILQRFRRPHDLIRKNLMASHVALGMLEPAKQLATEFMARNPKYTVAVEHRWPYRNPAQLERFKDHLRTAGLPG